MKVSFEEKLIFQIILSCISENLSIRKYPSIDRKMYSYQYMNSQNDLIFRYDNTEHHRKLNLPTFPHHKHDGSEDNVIKSDAPFLAEVLNEVKKILG